MLPAPEQLGTRPKQVPNLLKRYSTLIFTLLCKNWPRSYRQDNSSLNRPHSSNIISLMSTEQVVSTPTLGVAKHAAIHPLTPLTSSEITASATLIKGLYPSNIKLWFKTITLQEPEKTQVIPYLDAQHNDHSTGRIDRRAFINYIIRNTVSFPAGYSCTTLHWYRLLMLVAGQIP